MLDVMNGYGDSGSKRHEPDSPPDSMDDNKRRKSRKGLQKQYQCDEPDCGKKFTRLEHLCRHQLNHKPKQIFTCTWPECDKTFVREDLRDRHIDRHRKRASDKKGPLKNTRRRTSSVVSDSKFPATEAQAWAPAEPKKEPSSGQPSYVDLSASSALNLLSNGRAATVAPNRIPLYGIQSTTPNGSLFYDDGESEMQASSPGASIFNLPQPRLGLTPTGTGSRSLYGAALSPMGILDTAASPGSTLIDSRISDLRTTVMLPGSSPTSSSVVPDGLDSRDGLVSLAAVSTTMSMAADTKDQQLVPASGDALPPVSATQDAQDAAVHPNGTPDLISWLFSDAMLSNAKEPLLSPSFYSFDSPLSLHSLLSPPVAPEEVVMSEAKRQEILTLIPSLDAHVDSSLPYLQTFISKYWLYFHPQYPLLHKPSFQADTCPAGLLWAMIMIGAAYDKAYDFAMKIAEPLRFIIFGSADMNPPARLWVIQALLLVEVFEKSMSTRKFHERAHIHHGTLLQLIRRGPALTGDETTKEPDPWQRWVETEATKRAALAAFCLDVFDAAIFGHSLIMSVHEIRLSMPCSEDLWDRYPSEKSIPRSTAQPFLGELKKMLNKVHVDAGPFGRRILLSGLLCITLQMQQRDLQASSVGWGAFRNTWRDILTPAIDFWKQDHDIHAANVHRAAAESNLLVNGNPLFNETPSLHVSGCTWPFYHLSHIVMLSSPVDLQIFAGCPSAFNHRIRKSDQDTSARKIRELIRSVNGKQALWHAIRFLKEMFLSSRDDLDEEERYSNTQYGFLKCNCSYPVSRSLAPSGSATPTRDDTAEQRQQTLPSLEMFEDLVKMDYSAANDPIVERAHMVYVCAIVVWTYGYCTEGAESNVLEDENALPALASINERTSSPEDVTDTIIRETGPIPAKEDGYEFLHRMSCFRVSELDNVVGKNQVVGLLRLISRSLENQGWEVVAEGRRLINHCILRSLGSNIVTCEYMFQPRSRE